MLLRKELRLTEYAEYGMKGSYADECERDATKLCKAKNSPVLAGLCCRTRWLTSVKGGVSQALLI